MRSFLRSLLGLSLFVAASAGAVSAVRMDMESGLSLAQVVERARDNGQQPLAVLEELNNAGVDLVKAVQTIAREWHDCNATYAVAGAGARMAPLRADEVAASIANLRHCQCDAKSLWAKSRLNRRLRPEINRVLVKVGDVCSCAAAGIEATVEAAPHQAENVIEAVIKARNAPENTADSFGEVGHFPPAGQWQSPENPQLRSRDANLVRRPDACQGDRNERDNFDPAEQWQSLPLDNLASLGQHAARCDTGNDPQGDDQSHRDSAEGSAQLLILSQYYEGPGHNQALEFYNPGDQPIRLSDDPYNAEIYFHGYAVPGEVLNLKGVVPPRSTFVVVNALADNPQLRARANQLVFGLNFAGADAVVLKHRLDRNNCDCAVTAVAAGLRAGEPRKPSENDPKAAHLLQGSDQSAPDPWLLRLKQHYAQGDIPALVIDSAGEIPIPAANSMASDNSGKQQPPLQTGRWQRKPTVCFGDRLELDRFVPAEQWQVTPQPVVTDLGQHALGRCPETPPELLLTEMLIGNENNQALEIYNATPEPVDFSRDQYVVEIYRDDNLIPDQRFSLTGQLPAGAAMVVANARASEEILAKSRQKVRGLQLANSYSVVLRRVVTPAFRACFAEVADWLRKDPDPQYLSYIPVLVSDPFIGPQSGDDPRDGDHGGDLASPN